MYWNTTGLSRAITANMADVHRFVFTVETTCGKRWHASNCFFQSVAEGFRPLTAQGRGAQILLAEPTVEIDPLAIPVEVIPNDFDSSPISQTKATEVPVATFRGPRRSSKLQARLPTPGNVEEPTDSSVTSSESLTPEEPLPFPPPPGNKCLEKFCT